MRKTVSVFATILLVAAMSTTSHAKKFSQEEIGAKETCKKGDTSTPLSKCMKKFATKFCKEKGFKDYKAINWTSDGDYYVPRSINCS